MLSVTQSFVISLNKSMVVTRSPRSKHYRLTRYRKCTIRCEKESLRSATNGIDPAAVAASIDNVTFAGVSKTRNDLQSSCAILSSGNLPKPLTINDTSRAPMHGLEMRVVYQGVLGAYSEAAAGNAYPNGEMIPCDQFEVAFQAVELWVADRAVLPLENSLGGSIHRNYDLLLRHRLHIVEEVQLLVNHCLLALPGVGTLDLNRVISHPQALSQCELTLTKLGLKVTRVAGYDTAGAAELIAKSNLRDTAAIASKHAAKLYGLNVLVDSIHDDCNNVTRFAMLAREPIIPHIGRPFRTSIVFAHDNSTAVLFKVLSVFAFRNINLTKIESRPHRVRPITLQTCLVSCHFIKTLILQKHQNPPNNET
ncbi:putative arogenate dehydratase [Helianthus debilis subsp. tardiflorus]